MAKEHIQTFEKGMHLDNEPAFQPENSYRDCGHGRLLDHGEGNFSWTRLDGTEVQFSIEDGYTAVGYVEGDGETYIMYSNGTKHYIGKLQNNSLTPVYITTKQNFFVLNSQVRGFIDYESEEIVRMYWNDLITTPKTINLIDIEPISGTIIPQLTDGEKYLVTQGYFNQSGAVYNPGESFTFAVSATHGYSFTDTVLVKYVDPDLLDFNPLKTEARIDFTELVDGNLPAAPYLIAYRYYTEGYKTSWSGLFGPFSMFAYEGSVDLDNPGRLWHARFNGATPARNTGKGLKLQITGIDTRYEKIEVLAFKMIENGALETGRIVVEDEISSSSLNILITQYTGEQVSIGTYTSATVAIERINDLFDIKKTLAICGISEEDQLDVGQRLNNPNDFKAITYEIPAFQGRIYDRNLNDLNSDTYAGLISLKEDGTVRNGDILPGQYYKVLEGTVGYDGNTYTSDSESNIFLGKIDKPTWSDTGTVIPVFRICKYYDYQEGKNVFEYLDIRDQLGYKGVHSKRMAGYRSGETYRIGILPVGKRGTLSYVRWIDDITVPERGSSESEQWQTFDEDGKLVGPYITGYMKKYTETFRAADENKDYFNAQVASILVNVNLTDIIDDISGFYIVRCPVDKTILAEGPIANIIRREYPEEDGSTGREWVKVQNILEPKEHLYEGSSPRYQWGDYGISEWMPPDYLLGTIEELRAEDEFEISYKAIYQDEETIEAGFENPVPAYYHTFYPTVQRETSIQTSKITGIFKVENATEENELITDSMIGSSEVYRFHNLFKYTTPGGYTNGAAGGKCLILTHSDSNGWWDPDANSLKQVPIVRHKRNKSVLYGGTTSSALANSQYMYIGHFQKVDADFKKAIKTGNDYIARNIQLFGGDTYITMFTHARIIPFSVYKLVSQQMYGNVITLPLQTSVNPLARSGKNILGMKSPYVQLENIDDNIHSDRRIENFEDFTVNNSWNSDPEILYPGAPVDINKSTKFKNRIRYSNTKIDGAKIDAYRQFMANNFVDVLGRYGSVNALHGFGSRLIFWQDKAVGFIPVDERALTNDPDKIIVQLGVGGKFDRNDYIYEDIGLRQGQRTSLVYVDGNWIWYDATRKKFLHMTRSLELNDESFVKGAESFFEDIGDYSEYKDPSGKGGIVGIFSKKKNLVYMTFIKAGSYNTIAYNIKLRSFVSRPQWGPSLYIPQENELYGIAYNSQQVHKHDVESETAYGAVIEPYIEVIINPNLRDMKTFLGMLMRGGTNFFDEVTYKTVYDVVSSSYKNIAVDDVNELPENYQFVVDEWRFSVPEGNQGRMEGMYLYVKFVLKDMSKNIRMYQLVSNHNKLY